MGAAISIGRKNSRRFAATKRSKIEKRNLLFQELETRQLLAGDGTETLEIAVNQADVRVLDTHEVGLDDEYSSVVASDLPDHGHLEYYGTPVDTNTFIEFWNVEFGALLYVPDGDAAASYDDSIVWASSDDPTDLFQLNLSVSVAENTAPSASPESVTVDEHERTLTASQFGFADADGDEFEALTIDTVPTNGVLLHYGTTVSAGTEISFSNLDNGGVVYQRATDSDATVDSFALRVSDGTDWSEVAIFNLVLAEQDSGTVNSNIEIGNERPDTYITTDRFQPADSSGVQFTHLVVNQIPRAGQIVANAVPLDPGDTITADTIANNGLLYRAITELDGRYSTHAAFTVYDGETALYDARVNFLVEQLGGSEDSAPTNAITVSASGMAQILPADLGINFIGGYHSARFTSFPDVGTFSMSGSELSSGDEVDIWTLSYEGIHFQANDLTTPFTADIEFQLFNGFEYGSETTVPIVFQPVGSESSGSGEITGQVEWVDFGLGADSPATGKIQLIVDGQTSGDFQGLEYDVNQDGEFDGVVEIDAYGHFLNAIEVVRTGITSLGLRFTGDDGTVGDWGYHNIAVDWPSEQEAFGLAATLYRHSDIAPAGYTDRMVLVGNVTGVSSAQFVDIEVDFDGNQFPDEVLAVSSDQDFQLLLAPEVVLSKVWARAVRFDDVAFTNEYSDWVELTLTVPDSDDGGDSSSGDSASDSGDSGSSNDDGSSGGSDDGSSGNGDGSTDGGSGDSTDDSEPTPALDELTVNNLGFWPDAPAIARPELPELPSAPEGLVLSYEIGPAPEVSTNDGTGDSTGGDGANGGDSQSGSDGTGGDGTPDNTDGDQSDSNSDDEETAATTVASELLLGQFGSFKASMVGDIGLNAYDAAIAAAEADLDSDRAIVGANYSAAVAAATQAYSDAIAENVGPDLEPAAQAVTEATNAHEAAVASDTADAQQAYNLALANAQAERDDKKNQAQQVFEQALDAAMHELHQITAPIQSQIFQAGEDLNAGLIDQTQYDSLVASLNAHLQAAQAAHDQKISDAQKIRDDAHANYDSEFTVAVAGASKTLNDAVANAGKAEHQVLLDAIEAYDKLATTKEIAGHNQVKEAQHRLKKALAAALSAKHIGLISANERFQLAKQVAVHSRLVTAINERHSEQIESINREANAQIAAEDGSTEYDAVYRIAAVNAARTSNLAVAIAAKVQNLNRADADNDLTVVQIKQSAIRQRAAATNRGIAEEGVADAIASFKSKYFAKRESMGHEAAGFRKEASDGFDTATRTYNIAMGNVQKERTVRNSEELLENRKKRLHADNRRDHNLISQEAYEAEVEDLAEEADSIRRNIAVETFGDPSGHNAAPGGESAAKLGYLADNMNASMSHGIQKTEANVNLVNAAGPWIEYLEQETFDAQADRQDNDLATRVGVNQAVAEAILAWVTKVTAAESTFAVAAADASAEYQTDMAEASGSFQVAVTAEYAEAATGFATEIPENYNAAHTASIASAKLARVNALTSAYQALVGITAPVTTNQWADSVIAGNDLLLGFISESVIADRKFGAAETTYRAQMRKAENDLLLYTTHANKQYNSYASIDALDHHIASKSAAADRRWAMGIALAVGWAEQLVSVGEVLYDPNIRKERERIAGLTYIDAMVSANRDYEEGMAETTERRTKTLARIAADFKTAISEANAGFVQSVSDADKTKQIEVAVDYAAFERTLAAINLGASSAVIDAKATFAKAVVSADRDFTHATATADSTRSLAIAQAKHDAVVLSLYDETSNSYTPDEQYQLDYASAELHHAQSAYPVITGYVHDAADREKLTIQGMIDLEKQTQLDAETSMHELRFNVAGYAEDFQTALASANGSEQQNLAEKQKEFMTGLISSESDLSVEFAEKLKSHKANSAIVTGSATLAMGSLGAAFHIGDISETEFEDGKAAQTRAHNVDIRQLIKNRQDGFADSIDGWASNVAFLEKVFAVDQSQLVRQRVVAIAAAWDAYESNTTQARVRYVSDIYNQNGALIVQSTAASVALTNDLQALWQATSERLGEIDVHFATSVANAEATLHLEKAQDYIAELNHQADNGNNSAALQAHLKVVLAQNDYLQQVAPAYVNAMVGIAQNSVDYDDAVVAANTVYTINVGVEYNLYTTESTDAFVTESIALANANKGFSEKNIEELVLHVQFAADDNHWHLANIATVTEGVAVQYSNAETNLMRDEAQHALDSARYNAGLITTPPDQSYLDDYVAGKAQATFTRAVGYANSTADLKLKVLDLDTDFLVAMSDASKDLAINKATASTMRRKEVAEATRLFVHAAADHQKTYDQMVAQAGYNYVVADANGVKDAVTAQYDAHANVLRTHFGLNSDPSVQYTIATAVGEAARIQSLGPKFVSYQTDLADAHRTFAVAIYDAQAVATKAYADADRDLAVSDADADLLSVVTTATALREAQVLTGTANINFQKAMATIKRDREVGIAGLWRDARVEAGYWGDPVVDSALAAAINATASDQTEAAGNARDSAVEEATATYADALANAQHQRASSRANHHKTYSLAIISANELLAETYIHARHTLNHSEIDAEADYEIAELDANLAGLQALAIYHTTDATVAAAGQAGYDKPGQIADINTQRGADKVAADATRNSALDDLDDDAVEAVADVMAAFNAAIAAADAALANSSDDVTIVGIPLPGDLQWGVGVGSLVIAMGDELVDHLLDEMGHGQDDWSLPDLGSGIMDAFQGASDMEVFHFTLDVVGMVPVVGIAADLLNASIYLFEGNYVQAGLSGLAAIPIVGYAATAWKVGENAYQGGSTLLKAAKFGSKSYQAGKVFATAQLGVNVFQAGVAIGAGGHAVYQDPTDPSGYASIGLGILGLGFGAHAYRNIPNCFVAGTPVVMGETNQVEMDDVHYASMDASWTHPAARAAGVILGGLVLASAVKKRDEEEQELASDVLITDWDTLVENQTDVDDDIFDMDEDHVDRSDLIDQCFSHDTELEMAGHSQRPGVEPGIDLGFRKMVSSDNDVKQTHQASQSNGPLFRSDSLLAPDPSSSRNLSKWMLGVVAACLSVFSIFGPSDHSAPTVQPTLASAGQSPVRQLQPIETIQLGQRVKTDITAAQLRAATGGGGDLPWWDRSEIQPESWRQIEFEYVKPGGGVLTIQFLRPNTWVQALGARVGADVHLIIDEIQLDGFVRVVRIDPCPEISRGSGDVVTGRYIHSTAEVLDLRITGQEEPIGVTSAHPIYSLDRKSFVSAGTLKPGDRVTTEDGEHQVVSLSRGAAQPVFNLEIQGSHVFRVTDSGLLVHNADYPDAPRRGTLRSVGTDVWESSGGLRYAGRDRHGLTRVQHTLRHAEDMPRRRGEHGVFDAGRSGTLGVVDEAWEVAQQGGANVRHYVNRGSDVYEIDMGRRIGFVGGLDGAAAGNPAAQHIRIVIRNGNEVISVYPFIP